MVAAALTIGGLSLALARGGERYDERDLGRVRSSFGASPSPARGLPPLRTWPEVGVGDGLLPGVSDIPTLLGRRPAPAPLQAVPDVSPVAACDLRCQIALYSWDQAEAVAVMMCESGGDPRAVDTTRENFGGMQLNERTWRPFFGEARWARVLEAEENVAMAYVIYQRAGNTFLPWSCRP